MNDTLRPLQAWLRAASEGLDVPACCTRAAESLAGDPWRVVEGMGFLARSSRKVADRDLGLDARLRVVPITSKRALVRIPEGAPYPWSDTDARKALGAFDTPREMARRAVALAVDAVDGARIGLDPACGTGAFLVALAEAGLEVWGEEMDPRALAVARVAVPGSRLLGRDALAEGGDLADVVVGNPPFVSAERQESGTRRRLVEAIPWLHGRFDLAVPFAWRASLRARKGLCLVLPRSLLVQPYGRELRRLWLTAHGVAWVGRAERFPGADVDVSLVALRLGSGPAFVEPGGIHASELLRLDEAPLTGFHRTGDVDLVERIRGASVPMGTLAEIDTGVVSHGPGHSREDLLHTDPGPGRLPYVDASDLTSGRRRWLEYHPTRMHRAKHLGLFAPPKLLVMRITNRGPARAWLDREGLLAGHTLNVVRPLDERIPIERLLDLVVHPLVQGLLRLIRGERMDLYPHDLRDLPVPTAWLSQPGLDLASAWGLDASEAGRLLAVLLSIRVDGSQDGVPLAIGVPADLD